jgi:hypothetical protein
MAVRAPKGRLPASNTAGADHVILRLRMPFRNTRRRGEITPFDESYALPIGASDGFSKACRRASQVFFVTHPCIKAVANQYHRHAQSPLRHIALQNVNENAIFPPGVNSE